jgi:hypothetical protein
MKEQDIPWEETYTTGKTEHFMGMVFDRRDRRYIRVRRVIHSRLWNTIHNLIAHPLIAIYRPWGERLHNWTATKMYDGPQSLTEVKPPITAVTD